MTKGHASIVLVHGLFGGPWKTWSAKDRGPRGGLTSVEEPANTASVDVPFNYKPKTSKYVFWPKMLLPSAVENVKVYSFGYDADVERFISSAGLNTVRVPAGEIQLVILPHAFG